MAAALPQDLASALAEYDGKDIPKLQRLCDAGISSGDLIWEPVFRRESPKRARLSHNNALVELRLLAARYWIDRPETEMFIVQRVDHDRVPIRNWPLGKWIDPDYKIDSKRGDDYCLILDKFIDYASSKIPDPVDTLNVILEAFVISQRGELRTFEKPVGWLTWNLIIVIKIAEHSRMVRDQNLHVQTVNNVARWLLLDLQQVIFIIPNKFFPHKYLDKKELVLEVEKYITKALKAASDCFVILREIKRKKGSPQRRNFHEFPFAQPLLDIIRKTFIYLGSQRINQKNEWQESLVLEALSVLVGKLLHCLNDAGEFAALRGEIRTRIHNLIIEMSTEAASSPLLARFEQDFGKFCQIPAEKFFADLES